MNNKTCFCEACELEARLEKVKHTCGEEMLGIAKYAIAPNAKIEKYITPGKKYKIVDWATAEDFFIYDDDNDYCTCAVNRCAHLNGHDWILSNG